MGLFSGLKKSIGSIAGGAGMGFLVGGPTGALIGGGLGALSGQFDGSSQQKDANRMAMRAWHLANDYNHPINQMERLRAAGLNPLLVYGSGSVAGNTASSPNLVGGTVSTPLETVVKVGGKALSTMQGLATLDQTHATTAAQNAAAGASGAQAANLTAQAALTETRNKYEKQSLIADIDYKRALAAKTRAEASIAQGEADVFGSVGGAKGAKTGADTLKYIGRVAKGIMGGH